MATGERRVVFARDSRDPEYLYIPFSDVPPPLLMLFLRKKDRLGLAPVKRSTRTMGVEDKVSAPIGTTASTAKKEEKATTTTGIKTTTPPANQTLDITTNGIKTLLNLPISFSLQDEIRKATYTVANLSKTPGSKLDRKFIANLIKQADGLAIITVVRGSLIFSGQIGTGLVIGRGKDGKWTAPSAIGVIGSGVGLQWGINATDSILAFRTAEAASAFQSTHLALGASAGLSFGLGRQAEGEYHVQIGTRKLALTYGWSQTKGLYGGGSLDGTVIKVLHKVNTNFYGKEVDPSDLLTGKVNPPTAAAPLYQALTDLITEFE